MWVRAAAFGMGAGLLLVVGSLGLAAYAQLGILACEGADDCAAAKARQILAIELSLLGVILTSLATAALAWMLTRARPGEPRSLPSGLAMEKL